MNAFKEATVALPELGAFVAREIALGRTREVATRSYERLKRQRILVNDKYQVALDENPPHGFQGMRVWHLSIKRIDREPIRDFRDLQEIKTAIVGAEAEAIEVFPAESRLVDTCNQYHLWAFPDGERVPVGWQQREVCYESKDGAVQRPKDSSAA